MKGWSRTLAPHSETSWDPPYTSLWRIVQNSLLLILDIYVSMVYPCYQSSAIANFLRLPDLKPFSRLILQVGLKNACHSAPLLFTVGSPLWIVHIYEVKSKSHLLSPNPTHSSLTNMNPHFLSALHTVLCDLNAFTYFSPMTANAVLLLISFPSPVPFFHLPYSYCSLHNMKYQNHS